MAPLTFGLLPASVESQTRAADRWFVSTAYFEPPAADPREATFAIRSIWTDLFEDRAAPRERSPYEFDEDADDLRTDGQGEAALGGRVRIWQPALWSDGGVTVGLDAAVFGRFRLEVSSSDLVASDWIVGFPVELRSGEWSGRLRLFHWSAHLGDEMIEKAGAERIDFTHNGVELLLARELGALRLYGGGAVLSKSSLENEEHLAGLADGRSVQAGVEGSWSPWSSDRLGLEGAVDLQASQRAGWDSQWSLTGGLHFEDGEHALRLRGLFFDGPSPVGQFFLTRERYWGFELVIEL